VNKTMIKEITEKYNVKLYEVQPGDKYCQANDEESYHNSSYCAGSVRNDPELWLGFYDDEELRLISFFHEMGHMIDDTPWEDGMTVYDFEKIAWEKGYILAKEYGVKFSRKAKGWATRQLNSYKGFEEREAGITV